MALKLLKSLVLLGVPAVRGVVTGVERVDLKQASGQNPADPFHPRHLFQGSPDTDDQDRLRPAFARLMGMAGAVRAGRSGCPAGVSFCRGPAYTAGRGKRFSWPRITGSRVPAPAWRLTDVSAKRQAAGQLTRSGRSSGLLARGTPTRTAGRGQWAKPRLAHGTRWTSTRGAIR